MKYVVFILFFWSLKVFTHQCERAIEVLHEDQQVYIELSDENSLIYQ